MLSTRCLGRDYGPYCYLCYLSCKI